MKFLNLTITIILLFLMWSCSSSKQETIENEASNAPYQLMTLDPGHFHAALIQKMAIEDLDKTVYVFAPEGSDVQDHLNRIRGFNSRADNPTTARCEWPSRAATPGADAMANIPLSVRRRKPTRVTEAITSAAITIQ